MKVFISWSGARSRAIAELLSDWIKCVLQATRPWLSTRDIGQGALWFNEINDQLKDCTVGIVCLTQENRNKPWILFESGALAKGLSSNRVCTFLIDLETTDLENLLAQFNHTTPERASMWELVKTLNNNLDTNSLDERILDQVFSTYWDQFESRFAECLAKHPPNEKAEPRPKEEILTEILNNTRSLSQRLRALEAWEFVNRVDTKDTTTRGVIDATKKVQSMLDKQLRDGGSIDTAEALMFLKKRGYSDDHSERILRDAMLGLAGG